MPVHPCFNPRARAGRDFRGRGRFLRSQVSIHAPARGATGFQFPLQDVSDVSIHAPARGATCWGWKMIRSILVSIHAPARGATKEAISPLIFYSFQSTRPRGARPVCFSPCRHDFVFQSTRPRGARLIDVRTLRQPQCFNPRARAGRDGESSPEIEPSTVSIHAPARGAT